ncbi:MAG TPA: BrnT family toxin [Longimicrobium sp.]|nr:BrnT family toxin [Longimicrobium sp.]
METRYAWDPEKAESNYRKHGVLFSEARTVFDDPLMLVYEDGEHSFMEQRYLAVGCSVDSRLLLVAYTERADVIRIISAREVTRRERRAYEG